MTPADSRRDAFAAAYAAMLGRWPTTPQSLDVATDGASTRVQVWGAPEAPPLVLLHGFKVTSTMWGPQAAALGAIRRVYAPDTLGDYGFSTTKAPPRDLPELLRWLTRLADALGLSRFDIGGMSYGGWLSAHFAAQHPDRVRRLVLLAPGATFARFSLAFILRGLPMMLWHRRQLVESYLRWAAVPPRDPDYDGYMHALVDVMHSGHRHFPRGTLPLPAKLPATIAQRISAPTLLLYGAQEKMYDAERAVTRARSLVANLQPVIIPAASHDLTFGQPAIVNSRITQFLVAD